MASAAGPVVVGARTTHPSTPSAERDGNRCLQNQTCLYFLAVGGFYGVVILAIYVCLRRGNIIFSCLLFFFVFIPPGFKILWDKFQKKQSLHGHGNTETVERPNRHGTEDRVGGGDGSGSIQRSSRPMHGNINSSDLPPSYAETVKLYGVPENMETVLNTQPPNS